MKDLENSLQEISSHPEKAMAPYSSTLAWKIPWTEQPDGPQSMGSPRVGHDWATSLSLFTFMHWRRKWQPTPVFLPGESQGRGAWWAAVYGVARSRTRLTRLSSSSNSSHPLPFPGGSVVKKLPTMQENKFRPWVGKIPWRRQWLLTPISCLENTINRGAWWATVHGIKKSWTPLCG